MIPAIVVLFYLPYWWADPAACAGFRAGRHHRHAGRLLRAQARPDLAPRRVPRSGRGQADRRRRPGADREQGSALVRGDRGHRHHRPRDRGLGAARVDGGDRRARRASRCRCWGKYKTIMQIVGLSFLLFRRDLFGIAGLQNRTGTDGGGRRADAVVDDPVPAPRMAGIARQLGALAREPPHRAAVVLDSARRGPTIAPLLGRE